MDNTTWYYTLSTASQTLAALLGVSAVFVVLRLEGLSRSISQFKTRASEIIQVIDSYADPNKNLKKESSRQILGRLKSYQKNYPNITGNEEDNMAVHRQIVVMAQRRMPYKGADDRAFLKVVIDGLESFVEQRDDLFKMVKFPGQFTAGTIGLSMVLLALTDYLPAKTFLLLIVVALALLSVYSIFRATAKAFSAIIRLE